MRVFGRPDTVALSAVTVLPWVNWDGRSTTVT